MLIRDFNQDGVPDILTQGLHGIAVYEGYRVGEGIRFRPLTGDSFIDDSLVYTTRANRKTNIYHGPDDIPVIADVDGDGDLDIMTFDPQGDRKSTRLNSSHVAISYAVFCSKQKMQ